MDQVMDARARENDQLDRIVSAMRSGVILVDSQGHVKWLDEKTRRRVNGALQSLMLPVRRSDNPTLDCFMTPVEVTVNGEKRFYARFRKLPSRRSRNVISLRLFRP
jgi:hypothetical protein